MKNILFFISTILCSFVTNAQTKNAALVQFNSLSKAVFISQPYLQSLLKTKSPAKTQTTENKLIQLFFPADIIKGNSFELDGWTLNEGGSGFKINLKPGVKRGTWKTNLKDYYNNAVSFIDVGLSIDTKDTMLVLYHYSKTKKLLDRTNFVKANDAFTTGGESGYLKYQINKTLLTGKWTFRDMEVEFTNEGTVNGFDDATKYEIYDYTLFPIDQNNKLYSVMLFTNNDGVTKKYFFLIDENKLMLYERIETGNYPYKLGKLLHTIVKKI